MAGLDIVSKFSEFTFGGITTVAYVSPDISHIVSERAPSHRTFEAAHCSEVLDNLEMLLM